MSKYLSNKKLAFLGAGNMGGALIKGLLAKKTVKPAQIVFHDPDKNRSASLRKIGAKSVSSNREAANQAKIIIVCVKPDKVAAVLEEIGPCLESIGHNPVLISIAAGVTTQYIERLIKRIPDKNHRPVIRVMPNLPAIAGAGVTAICGGEYAGKEHVHLAKYIFNSVGTTVELPERFFNAVTAVSGSGPAYVFYLAEAMHQAAAKMKIPGRVAAELIKQTIYGAGNMLKANNSTPMEQRLMVTSPGGTTEAAVRHLEAKHAKTIFAEAIVKAKIRAEKLVR